MAAIYALAILMGLFALGELVAQKTKAILSTTLVVAFVLMILFWIGLPKDIMDKAAVVSIGMNMIGLLIVAMGNMMDIPELIKQWKTVVISLAGVLVGVLFVLFLGQIFLGRDMAVAGAPIFAGANIAALIMIKTLSDKGLDSLQTFVVLMLVVQNFVGIPIASTLLRKEAKKFIENPDDVLLYSKGEEKTAVKTEKRKLLQLPASFNRPSVALTKLALLASLSFFISGLTKGNVHYFVVALLVGVIFTELGFLEKGILAKSESSGFIVFVTTIIIFGSLAKTTPQLLLSLLAPLLIALAIGAAGVIISGIITGKLLKVSPYLAIAMGLTCTFGFPTTMLMPKEVSVAIGRNEQEVKALENYMMPKMITAGFVTVTIASVVIAGVVSKII